MSGGHYNYLYYKVQELADEIESEFINNGKYIDYDYSIPYEKYCFSTPDGKPPKKEFDRIGDATPEERKIILKEIKSLIKTLKKCAFRAKELEWYMSGDTGATSYLDRIKKQK